MARDFLRTAITDLLLPDLKAAGFTRTAPKAFARVRGDLADGLTFQLSRWGSKCFYVHAWTIPLCAPPQQGYVVGRRHDGDDKHKVEWTGASESNARLAIASLHLHYFETIEPWFQSMPSLEAFVSAYLRVPSRRRKSAEYLAMMLVLGRTQEYEVLLREIDERKEEQSPDLLALRQAQENGTALSLIDRWREEGARCLKCRSVEVQRGGA